MQSFLDNAKHGAVYFSLGTNVQSTAFDEEQKNIIMEILSDLPYKVLWKYEGKDLKGKPENVLTAAWFPQQDILSKNQNYFLHEFKFLQIEHPNVKVFITQGGLQSIEEAIFANVPMVGLPFFADQLGNIQAVVEKQIGILVSPENFDKNKFKNAILNAANSTE